MSIEAMLACLDPLRERIFAGDNTHCFIERQELFAALAPVLDDVPEEERYAFILEELLAHVSTPIEPEDVILGRVVEGPWPEGRPYVANLPGFSSVGHICLDWEALLAKGLDRIAAEAQEAAARLGTDEARWFAASTTRCCQAITAFSRRYARAARHAAEAAEEPRQAWLRAAAALEAAPAGPAPDFFSALQAIWVVQLVTSCFIGSRDFAFGRMDQYLLPLYERGLAEGSLSPELARAMLAHFFLKTKEITGTATDTYRQKPVPCHASNQYVVIGGRGPDGNEQVTPLSFLILEAACLARVPQPEINVRLDPGTSPRFKAAIAAALPLCHHQIQFWNDAHILDALRRYPITEEDRFDYAFTACNRINIPGRMDWQSGDIFHNMARWLLAALNEGRDPVAGECVAELPPAAAARSMDDVLAMFGQVASAALAAATRAHCGRMEGGPREYHFESALLRDCVAQGKDLNRGGVRYRALFHFFGGIATVADSLLAIRRLVFDERRFSLPELLAIVAANFEGHEILREEIRACIPKYGNGIEEADALARAAGEAVLDALARAPVPDGVMVFSQFYSLHSHTAWGKQLPATPDGRLAGEPVSENQSPTHGMDREGVTALLQSVSRLSSERTAAGGLNVMLAGTPSPDQVMALVDAFFRMGGIHVGFTFADRKTLLAAQADPGRYRSLCVRITGFSEHFVALSPDGQRDIIERTPY